MTQACLYRQFRAVAARHPDRAAVVAPDGMRTYAELEADVTRLAAGLSSHDIGPGDRLALLLDRGVDAVIAMLTSMRLGTTFIAMDPAFPPARLAAIMADSQPKLVLYQEEHAALLGSWAGPVLTTARAFASASDGAPPGHVASGEDPMYIIYTSGSTGIPKGIVQTFRTIRNLVRWENDETGIRFAGRVLQNSSLAFDVSLQEILSTLVAGGSLFVSQPDERIDPDLMIRLLRNQRINVVFFSVSTLTQLFARADRLSALPDTLTDIVTAGEQLYIGEALRQYLLDRPGLRLHNHYGVSESHVVTAWTINGAARELPVKAPIGMPVAGSRIFLQGADGHTVSQGQTGEVVIAGECLALGYLNRPEEERKRFVTVNGERRYLTGDLAFERPDGNLEFVGRIDQQLKIRGHLVEPGDVEAALRRHPAVIDAVVDTIVTEGGERQLAAWYTTTGSHSEGDLRAHLTGQLPYFMVPSRLHRMDMLPTGSTGKVDREELRRQTAPRPRVASCAGEGLSRRVLELLRQSLGRPDLAEETAFFEAGATSLTLVQAAELLGRELAVKVSTVDLFRFPSSAELAAELDRRAASGEPAGFAPEYEAAASRQPAGSQRDDMVAVIGMACRFPGAKDVHALWQMLITGRHGLVPQSATPASSWWVPQLPDAGGSRPLVGLIEDAYRFDAGFFGYSKRAADWLDPQHRLLLMCAYAALESSGYPPSRGGHFGVYAGAEFPGYIANVRPHVGSMDDYLQSLIGNDKDFLASRVAHKLNLTGPAITVQTACSTSLVAVHLARQALLLGECDVALAGGVSLVFPQEFGHRYEEGLIYSPDGMTRPFATDGAGTNMTSGVAMVVLKPLSKALADRDPVLAIIRGSAVNNDGADKVGYTAPSVGGQARVIQEALRAARLSPADIDLVEAHGTATPLGDAVELAALDKVFGHVKDKKILLGSVKGNIGHTNRASGVAGLIKAVLALHHGKLPATVGHRPQASETRLADGSFTLAVSPTPLRAGGAPNRAGISSFGFGGTNAHVVAEQWRAPAQADVVSSLPQLLTLSADRPDQLAVLATELASYLEATPEITVADAAYTRNTGRDRRALVLPVVAGDRAELIERLRAATAEPQPAHAEGVVFLMPGGGRADMLVGAKLYQRYAGFRQRSDEVLAELRPANSSVLRAWLTDPKRYSQRVTGLSELLHPLVFLLSRATALLLMDWGITPRALVGSSLGEFAAASVAGALPVRDAALLVEERGRLEDTLAPAGAVISAELTWTAAAPLATAGAFRCAHNSRGHVLFAGSAEGMNALEERLVVSGVTYRRLPHRRPNHTPLMRHAAEGLRQAVQSIGWQKPKIPVISCVDGEAADIFRLADPDHWVRHSVQPIRLAEALDQAATMGGPAVFIETGPPAGMASLADFHFADDERFAALAVLPKEGSSEDAYLLEGVGELLRHGIAVDLGALHSGEPANRVLLPTYPFGGDEHLLPTPHHGLGLSPAPSRLPRERWAYRMTCPVAPLARSATQPDCDWLLIGSDHEELGQVAGRLSPGPQVLIASPDEDSVSRGAASWQRGRQRLTVCYLDGHADGPPAASAPDPLLRFLPVYRALVRSLPVDKVSLIVVTRGAYLATGDITGPAALTTTVIIATQEQPGLRARHVDFADGVLDIDILADEVRSAVSSHLVVYRGRLRTAPRYDHTPMLATDDCSPPVHDETILVTGGLGNVGFEVCRHMGGRGARLLIVSRTQLTDADPAGAAAQRQLATLRAAGIMVSYQQADVTDRGDLAAAVAAGEAELGPVRGVVHAAAKIGGDSFLSFLHHTRPEILLSQVTVKAAGVDLIDEILRERELIFRLAFSSNSVILGGLGYGCYAAANAFMGEIASRRPRWHVIDWDIWDASRATSTVIPLATSAAAQPMAVADALACLDDVLAGPPRRVLLSTTDLAERASLVEKLTVAPSPPEPAGITAAGGGTTSSAWQVARAAWRRALGVTVDDDAEFVGLGGDSLSAIKVVLEVNRVLGSSLSAQDMLRAATFSDFVRRIEQNLRAADPDATAEPLRSGGLDRTPAAEHGLLTRTSQPQESVASLLQERWFAMHARGYGHIELRVRIAGPLDPELAAQAIRHICRRHAILRSRYEPRKRLIARTVADHSPEVLFTDLAQASTGFVARAIHDAGERASRPFDLTTEVPFEVEFIRLDAQDHLLIGRMHHIAVDGWSFSLLLEDFERVYQQLDQGNDPGELPDLPQYAHFAATQREYVESGAIEAARAAWRSNFRGAAGPTQIKPSLTSQTPDPEVGQCINVTLDAGIVRQLTETARTHQTTRFPILVTAFALMLQAVTGEDDLIFGTTGAGRHVPGSEAMIGVFVNPLPIRVNLTEKPGLRDALLLVTDQLMKFHQWQNYILADLINHVEPFTGLDINETFHNYILYQNYPRPQSAGPREYCVQETDDLGDKQLARLRRPHGKLMREFELIVIEQADGNMSLNFWYRQGLFSSEQVRKWSEIYADMIRRLVRR